MGFLSNKKLKRNLLIIAGVFVIVFVILLIFSDKSDSRNLSYMQIEQKLIDASESYLNKTELLPTEDAGTVLVSSEVLISNKYMKSFDKMTKDTNCFGQVTVQKTGQNYNYMPYLICDNYRTKTLKSEIASLVRDDGEDGVYLINDEYVYRGEKVNNYFKMGNNMWRIIKVTDDGYLKLVNEKSEEKSYVWDNRYNVKTKDYSGINDYEKSRISETLTTLYLNKENFGRLFIVPRKICVGQRAYDDFSLDSNTECDVKSKDLQYIDLINSKDLAYASLDKDCTQTNSMACNNYNYFSDFFYGSWSLISEKDKVTAVYFYDIAYREAYKANSQNDIYLVVYLNANNLVKKGDGSMSNPYMIN